jgi:hypothetical protein
VTRADLLNELQLSVESYEAKLHLRDLNVLASPAQEIRETFDLMPHATTSDWSTIAEKLGNVPGAVSGYGAGATPGERRRRSGAQAR